MFRKIFRPRLDQNAVLQRQHPVHPGRQRRVMGRDQCGHPRIPHKRKKHVEHTVRCLGVQIAGRLIGQQKPRGVGQGPAKGDALLLTS